MGPKEHNPFPKGSLRGNPVVTLSPIHGKLAQGAESEFRSRGVLGFRGPHALSFGGFLVIAVGVRVKGSRRVGETGP